MLESLPGSCGHPVRDRDDADFAILVDQARSSICIAPGEPTSVRAVTAATRKSASPSVSS